MSAIVCTSFSIENGQESDVESEPELSWNIEPEENFGLCNGRPRVKLPFENDAESDYYLNIIQSESSDDENSDQEFELDVNSNIIQDSCVNTGRHFLLHSPEFDEIFESEFEPDFTRENNRDFFDVNEIAYLVETELQNETMSPQQEL